MRAPRQTQEERVAETRRVICEATVDSLAAEGYKATTIAAVQKRAGVSRGAISHHFATKNEMISAAMTFLAAALEREVEAKIRLVPAGTDQIRFGIDLLWDLLQGAQVIALMELWSAARADFDLRETYLDAERSVRAVQRKAFEATLGAEVVATARFGVVMDMTIALLRGLVLSHKVRPRDQLAKEIVELWAELFTGLVDDIEREIDA